MMVSHIKTSAGEKIGKAIIAFILCVIGAMCIYPMVYVFSMSLSDVMLVLKREIWLLPKKISFDAYQFIFKRPDVWIAYYNTIWYTVVGTAINVVLTVLVAFPLSRKTFVLRKPMTFLIALTMWFGGGMIPSFILVRALGMYGTRWSIVLPGAITAWNVIITRTFFEQTIPDELLEAGRIDGANDLRMFFRIVLPLSQAIIAVNILFYSVEHWNSFFNAILYLPKKQMQPLQMFLRTLLFSANSFGNATAASDVDQQLLVEKLKYAVVVFAMLPITFLYPFLQKYFVKGVMIGSLKG
ncbi:MAG: carbohydrate ABC transporter permease [Treponema sp.]|nr:carbohydrate ABC transporter permease [Treponema sp.]